MHFLSRSPSLPGRWRETALHKAHWKIVYLAVGPKKMPQEKLRFGLTGNEQKHTKKCGTLQVGHGPTMFF